MAFSIGNPVDYYYRIFAEKMRRIGYDGYDVSEAMRLMFKECFFEYANNEQYRSEAERYGFDFDRFCAALAQLRTNKKTGCSGNDAYNIQLFWDFSNDELDYVINHCPDEFNRLELTAFYERIEVMRASEEWQRAGAYSVRIQGMNRQHHISLREEFDEYDKDGTRYIVILYDGYPVATCRFYEADPETVIMGRVVVLPEYRNRFLGTRVIGSAEKWIKELKYKEILIDSRLEVVSFYEKLGYIHMDDSIKKSGNFECIRMHKYI